MTEIELAYAAGLFDGEGCVSINKTSAKNYKRNGFQLRCSISITHEATSQLFANNFGGTHKLIQRKSGGRDYWQWVIVARQARDFLIPLQPYLQIKKEVASIGIEFQNYRDNNQAFNKTDEYWNREQDLYVAVRKCNARWGTEYYVA